MKNVIANVIVLLLLLSFSDIFSMQNPSKINKTFPVKKLVEIHTVSGDCIIKKGPSSQITVDLEIKVDPADAFKPEFDERTDRLKLSEDWSGRASGSVTWTVTVPPETEIELVTASGDVFVNGLTKEVDIKTASGNITIENSAGDIEVKTASGDVMLKDSGGNVEISVASGDVKAVHINGDIEISAASGDINIDDSKGEFELSTASGDIEAVKIFLDAESEISAASGDIEVSVAKTPATNLTLETASGNLELNYNGNPLKGKYEFTGGSHARSIEAPLEFDKEETFEKHGRKYVRKTVSVSGDEPVIIMETASGKITLKK